MGSRVIHNTMLDKIYKKDILIRDRERWLEIMEMLYSQYKKEKDPVKKGQIKDLLKFCGEQSLYVKGELAKIKK